MKEDRFNEIKKDNLLRRIQTNERIKILLEKKGKHR